MPLIGTGGSILVSLRWQSIRAIWIDAAIKRAGQLTRNPCLKAGFFTPRVIITLALWSAGALLAIAGLANAPPGTDRYSGAIKNPGRTKPFLPASTESVWSVMPSPNASAAVDGALSGIACTSSSNCFAVGSYINGSSNQTLIEQWNGSSWSVLPSPNVGSGYNYLVAVTCASTTQCFAVGYAGNQTLIEQWNGSSWTIVPSPNVSGALANFLTSVTCTSQTTCLAVGYSETYNGAYSYQTLVEQWNGTSWSIVASPNASATQDNQLLGVTCASATNCFAVGFYSDGGDTKTLIEQWNGTSWSIVASPNTGTLHASLNDHLYSVTCTSTTQCFAVGRYLTLNGTALTLIEQWNGSSWAIVTSPNNGSLTNYLRGVTCISATNCLAVGEYYNGGDTTLIEQWNGSSWSIVTSANTSNPTNDLNAITCTSANNCFAVGSYYASTHGGILAEQWNGASWSVIPGGLQTTTNNQLNAATCTSANNCFAVGTYFNGDVTKELIEQWNGSSWSVVSPPSGSFLKNYFLTSVTCSSATDCFAVGDNYETNYFTLIEHWTGSSWAIVPSADRGTFGSYLSGVACASATSCFAVGYSLNISVYQTLIEQWNGASWALVPSANAGSGLNNYLYSINCPSATQCFAVGDYFNGSVYQSVIEQWDGTSWTIATSLNTSATQSNYLTSVACGSATQCVAAGYSFNGSVFQTLIEQWDGTSWSIVATPNGSSASSFLYGVTCTSTTNCFAVGSYSNQALIEQWDGASWTIAPSPSANTARNNNLKGVTCASPTSCFAAGFYLNYANNVDQTLIEEYSPTIPSISGVVSRKIHGSAGTFDLDLPLVGKPGVECRNAGATGTAGIDHELVFSFVNNVTGCGTSSMGTLRNGPGSNQCSLDLAGIANQQSLTVTLNNVLDSENNSGAVSITMGVLLGDVNGDGVVNVGDTVLVRSQSGNSATTLTFRFDLNADGLINVGDSVIVRNQSGTSLP